MFNGKNPMGGFLPAPSGSNPLFGRQHDQPQRGMFPMPRGVYGTGPWSGIATEQAMTPAQREKLGTPHNDMFRQLIQGAMNYLQNQDQNPKKSGFDV
jgi:hypothetical protein